MDPLFLLSASELRRFMDQQLRTDSDFDAFVLDHFPRIKHRFTASMDRVSRTNLLFETVERSSLCVKLRATFPAACFYVFKMEAGPDDLRHYPLPSEEPFVIGRAPGCDILLLHPLVSRRHAVVEVSAAGEVFLNSEGKLPVLVNGRETARRVQLWSGDQLKIHETALQLIGFSRDPVDGPSPTWLSPAEPTAEPEPERSFWESQHESTRLVLGLAERMLAMQRLEPAERIIEKALSELRAKAEPGDVPANVIVDLLRRVLKLAVAAKKAPWFAWLFEFALLCKYQMPIDLLDEIHAGVASCRPAIGATLAAYAPTLKDPACVSRLSAIMRLC